MMLHLEPTMRITVLDIMSERTTDAKEDESSVTKDINPIDDQRISGQPADIQLITNLNQDTLGLNLE
jgi:hypothetical protein